MNAIYAASNLYVFHISYHSIRLSIENGLREWRQLRRLARHTQELSRMPPGQVFRCWHEARVHI